MAELVKKSLDWANQLRCMKANNPKSTKKIESYHSNIQRNVLKASTIYLQTVLCRLPLKIMNHPHSQCLSAPLSAFV